MTEDAYLIIICKTGSSRNKKQHAVGCEYNHTVVHSRQLTVKYIVGVRWEPWDQCIDAHNRNPPWSTKPSVHTVSKNEHHEVVSSRMNTNQFRDKCLRDWTKKAVITLKEATEAYMVEVIAASQYLKQQLISCRYSTCLLWWQAKQVVYSWSSPTWAWHWIWPKWPKVGFSCTAIEEMQYLIKNPCT